MNCTIHPPLFIHEIGQRDNQEDALWPLNPTSEDRLFVLCDGMGGHEHGEVASQTVCQAIGEWYQTKAVHPIDKPQIEDAIAYAYEQLDQKDNGGLRKMGTTLTLLYIGSNGAIAAHMGDSRIYHIRPITSPGGGWEGAILYQSRDHSLVFDLFQAGEITYEEMATYPQKNIITRAMTPGEDNRMRPDIIHITDVQPGDYFYLCSDGMLEQMSNDELLSLFSFNVTDEEKRQKLLTETANNQDNHTAWVIHVKDVFREDGDVRLTNEEPTSRYNALNIITQKGTGNDVIIAENDDVVVVSAPKVTKSKCSWLIRALSIFVFLFVLIVIWFLYTDDEDKKTPIVSEPVMQVPINRDSDKAEKKDSIIIIKHGSGNQQIINAPRRNHPSWDLQNR